VVVVPLSTGPTPRPPIVVATPSAGEGSVAVCDQLRAVDRTRMVTQHGKLAAGDLRAVEEGIRAVLGL
jgi:mRNA interferase MazF